MKPRRSTPMVGLVVAVAAVLALVSGCANPRGTASSLSPIQPVSSAAVPSLVASSPAPSTPAPASPVASNDVVASALASTNSAGSTHLLDSTQISGAVTADSERQLVLSYVGGICDVSARGEAVENATSITVHVLVTVLNGACTAQGFDRTVTAQLAGRWGGRPVRDVTGAAVPIIDGALLLRPSWLPDGYQGGPIYVGSSDGNVAAVQEWALPRVPPTPSAGVGTCTPSSAVVDVSQGYGLGVPPSVKLPLVPGSHTLADGTSVTVYTDQGELMLFWTPQGRPKGWTVSLVGGVRCEGDQPLSFETLLKIANSLH